MAERRDNKNRILRKGEYQKADGRYMYKYKTPNGKDKFVYSWTLNQNDRPPSGKSIGVCLRDLEKIVHKDIDDEIDTFSAKKITINKLYESYFSKTDSLKPSTRTTYASYYKRYVINDFGNKKILDVKSIDVRNFYTQLLEDEEISINSLNILNNIIRQIFDIALENGYIRKNPTKNIVKNIRKSHKNDREKKRALTIEEQEAFINFVKNSHIYSYWLPLFTTLLGTGCRIGEIMGLTWDDCDFDNNIISINHNLQYIANPETGKYEYIISSPKTKASKREIPMFKEVREALLLEKDRQSKQGFNTVTIDGYTGFVFKAKYGQNCLTTRGVRQVLKNIINAYNKREMTFSSQEQRNPILLPHFTAHNLRHTFCTRMCENESNIKIIQEIMGHTSITTTMNIYADVTRNNKKKSFESMECKFLIA